MSFSLDWLFPVILASLVFNLIFVIGAIIHSFLAPLPVEKEAESEPRVSLPASTLSWQDRRHSSLSPQVIVYHNLVRFSISNNEGRKPNKKGFWDIFRCRTAPNEYATSSPRKVTATS